MAPLKVWQLQGMRSFIKNQAPNIKAVYHVTDVVIIRQWLIPKTEKSLSRDYIIV